MNYSHYILFAEDLTQDDEIDALFSQLQPITPPSTLVENILASVARMALPTQHSAQKMWEHLGLVVHHEDKEPS
ncbi:MAG: hypothetical protein NVS4B11_06670 [Ktedonobacteraceae bacterium]